MTDKNSRDRLYIHDVIHIPKINYMGNVLCFKWRAKRSNLLAYLSDILGLKTPLSSLRAVSNELNIMGIYFRFYIE